MRQPGTPIGMLVRLVARIAVIYTVVLALLLGGAEQVKAEVIFNNFGLVIATTLTKEQLLAWQVG